MKYFIFVLLSFSMILLVSCQLSSKDTNKNTYYQIQIPQNKIIKELADDTILPPANITTIESINGISPEVSISNGNAIVFTQKNLTGWSCKTGDKINFKFEKYKSDVTTSQTMIIGYVLNGVLHSGEEFKELDGLYQLDIPEDGDYYIYIINAASDELTLKEGNINLITHQN